MKEIPFGTLNSKFYEKGDELYYKVSPVFLQQINFILDAPVSKIRVIKNSGDELLLKKGILKLKMLFKPYVPGLQKLRIIPYYFGLLPMGIYFCEISESDKEYLLNAFKNS